jgi:hypothetical protein
VGVALFLFVCAETNTCMFTAKKMPPTRKQRYMLACAQCGRDARLDAKRSKKKRCFKVPYVAFFLLVERYTFPEKGTPQIKPKNSNVSASVCTLWFYVCFQTVVLQP